MDQPDPGDQPGLAAPRLGGGLSRHPPPGDRGVPRDPQTLRRLQPQGAEPAPRRARSPTSSWKPCATATSSSCARPKDGSERGKVDARSPVPEAGRDPPATGEPYIIFIDQVNRSMPKHHRDLGLKVSTSNLCSEITLPTGRDHLGADRTAVCCLSSLSLETWDEWNGDKQLHRGRHALPRQRAVRLYRPRARTRWPAPSTAPSASARSAWA